MERVWLHRVRRAGGVDAAVAGQRCLQLVLQLRLVHRLGLGRADLLRVEFDAAESDCREISGVMSDRSHALRGNAARDAPRSRSGRRASRDEFPCGAWELAKKPITTA
ncbi:hypothetical protein EMIT0194MI4_40380 [Pseudomonas sp. IT-194MI4]